MSADAAGRQGWLIDARPRLAAILEAVTGERVPPAYLSVGFPKGGSGRRRPSGQCWSGTFSKDGRHHVFISPEEDDEVVVLGILLHELIHTIVGPGHRGEFVRVSRAVGFAKPWSKTPPGPALALRLRAIGKELGRYPHAALTPPPRRQGSTWRYRLWRCPCGFEMLVDSDRFRHFAATCSRCGKPFVEVS